MKAFKAAVVIAAAVLAVSFGGASAATYGGGGSFDAPGFEQALEQCIANLEKQKDAGTRAGGGPKTVDNEGPTNCDHFWQFSGAIGN